MSGLTVEAIYKGHITDGMTYDVIGLYVLIAELQLMSIDRNVILKAYGNYQR